MEGTEDECFYGVTTSGATAVRLSLDAPWDNGETTAWEERHIVVPLDTEYREPCSVEVIANLNEDNEAEAQYYWADQMSGKCHSNEASALGGNVPVWGWDTWPPKWTLVALGEGSESAPVTLTA